MKSRSLLFMNHDEGNNVVEVDAKQSAKPKRWLQDKAEEEERDGLFGLVIKVDSVNYASLRNRSNLTISVTNTNLSLTMYFKKIHCKVILLKLQTNSKELWKKLMSINFCKSQKFVCEKFAFESLGPNGHDPLCNGCVPRGLMQRGIIHMCVSVCVCVCERERETACVKELMCVMGLARSGVDFTNILCEAFTHADPKRANIHSVKPSVSFCAFWDLRS